MDSLPSQILGLIHRNRPISDAVFNRLALRLFVRQKSLNPVYRRYCESTGAAAPKRWQDVPALPVSAFKYHRVSTFPKNKALRTFLTSGTTRGALRGRHAYETLAFFDATARTLFREYILPDVPVETRSAGARLSKDSVRMNLVFLVAPSAARPESSLGYMGECVRRTFGAGRPFYALNAKGVAADKLTQRLMEAVRRKKPVLIYTTTFALADYLDYLAWQKIRLRLPRGSRIMETGGYKGRRTQVERPTLVRRVERCLGIPAAYVVNEYGMTELTSQFYDRSLAGLGRCGAKTRPVSIKGIPPWTRVQMIHPATGRPVAKGKRGLIRIYDLANQGSCFAIQTEDEGRLTAGGFEILGRQKGADLRGCSLTFEEMKALSIQ